MKFLCLAYGDEQDWKELTKEEQTCARAKGAIEIRPILAINDYKLTVQQGG